MAAPLQTYPDRHAEPDLVVFPVAGIFETRLLAKAHFKLMQKWLSRPGVMVEPAYAHRGLGIVGSVKNSAREFQEFMDHRLSQYGSGMPYMILPHSYGTLPALDYHARNGAKRPGSSVVAMGGPLGDMRHLPFIPPIIKAIDPYTNRCNEFAEFVEERTELLTANGLNDTFTATGSTIDESVPLQASVPLGTDYQKVVFSQFGRVPHGYDGIRTLAAPLMEHMDMPMHPSMLRYLGSRVTETMTQVSTQDQDFNEQLLRPQFSAV
jgi:hypothetical protein